MVKQKKDPVVELDLPRLEEITGAKLDEVKPQLLTLVQDRARLGVPIEGSKFYTRARKIRACLDELHKLTDNGIGRAAMVTLVSKPSRQSETEQFLSFLKNELVKAPLRSPRNGRPTDVYLQDFIARADFIYEQMCGQKLQCYWSDISGKFKGARLDFVCELLDRACRADGAPYSRHTVAKFIKSLRK